MKKSQRFLSIVGALAFFSSTAFATTRLFQDSQHQNPSPETTEVNPQEQLMSYERGYLKVLEREPQNQVALEGLVRVRLQMNNLEGLVEPLETLMEINPEDQTYQTIYTQLQEQLNTGQSSQPEEESSDPNSMPSPTQE